MRHGKKINHLSRTKEHRQAMLSNMATSLIMHKRIFTTTAKAKALRKYVEPLITKSKSDNTHSRRVVFSYLQNKDAVIELFSNVADKIGDRPGGYTRILKTHNRLGDNAEMCMIELVDFNEMMLEEKAARSAKSGAGKKRTRRGKKPAAAATAETTTETKTVEAVATEEATETAEPEVKVEEVKAEEIVEAEVVEETTEEVPAEEPAKEEPTSEDANESADAEEDKKD